MVQIEIVGIFIIYLVLLLGIGIFFYLKGMEDIEDYFLAGKGAPWYLVGASFFATAIGGAGNIGLTASTFQMQTISAFWTYGVTIFSSFIVAFLLGKKLPLTESVTIPELLEDRYDEKTRVIAIPFYIFRFFTTLGVQWLAAGTLISFLSGQAVTVKQAAIIGAIIVTIYAVLGGMPGELWIEFVQAIVLFVGFWVLVFSAINNFGGWSAMTVQITAQAPQAFNLFAIGPALMFGYIITLLPTLLVRQGYLQRVMAAKSSTDGFVGTNVGGILGVAYIGTPLILGAIAIIQYPNIADPKFIIPQLATDVLSVWGAGLVLAALAASLMSTAESFLLSGASNLTEDVYLRYINPDLSQEYHTTVSRIATVFLAVFGLILGFLVPGLIDLIILGVIGLTGGILVPWLGAFYWPRGTSDAAFWSLSIGGTSTIAWWVAGAVTQTSQFLGVFPVYIGLSLSILLFFGISYLQEPEYENVLEAAEKHDMNDLKIKTQKAMQEREPSAPMQSED